MLGKLYKYDFKCTARKMLPFYVLFYVIALLRIVVYNFGLSEEIDYVPFYILYSVIKTAFSILCYGLVIGGYAVSIGRFKKNIFSDEGYLMNTLPVKPSCHIWSKLLNSLTWFVISIFVALSGLFITGKDIFIASCEEIFDLISSMIEAYGVKGITALAVVILLAIFSAVGASLAIMFFTAFENVSTAMKSKVVKVVITLGVIFLINLASYLYVEGILEIVDNNDLSGYAQVMLVFGSLLGISVILSVVFFMITNYLMKNKLNLE